MKLATSIETLCKGYPLEFAQYFREVRSLKYGQRPKYSEMRERFKKLF